MGGVCEGCVGGRELLIADGKVNEFDLKYNLHMIID